MQLISISVKNFRSLADVKKIPLGKMNVLIGKNNEGKSNLLTALSIALNTISNYAKRPRRPHFRSDVNYFNWDRDFPISEQERKGGHKKTTIKLEFSLTDDDIKEIQDKLQVKLLNKILLVDTTFKKYDRPQIETSDKGLNSVIDKFTTYLDNKIAFNYIPAIRTSEQAKEVMDETLSNALREIEVKKDYKKAIKTIESLRKPILKKIANEIRKSLSEFLPNIKKVEIEMSTGSRFLRTFRSDFDIIVDDGTATSIDYKGDGVKSLATLGILKNSKPTKDLSIIAIEEPETHLHPGAMHQLKEIIASLETSHQVVLTTHSPIFVNRKNINSNIIIDGQCAKQAKTLMDIRDVLGILVSDNLTNAKYTLVVEGLSDKRSLESIFKKKSYKIKKCLETGEFIIQDLKGASNLPAFLSSNRNNILCDYYVFLDHDMEAKNAIDKAKKNNLIDMKNCSQAIFSGKRESELEDFIKVDIYSDFLNKEFGIDVNNPSIRQGNKKWSDRLTEIAKMQGKTLEEENMDKIKTGIADCVVKCQNDVIMSNGELVIERLVKSLEELIK